MNQIFYIREDNYEGGYQVKYNDFICDSLYLYNRDIEAYKLLTPEEEKELFIKLREGDSEAKEKLITSNLRLVLTVVKKFRHKCNIPTLDLIQEGNIGLIKAVQNFDESKGYKFSTYATIAITTSIVDYVSTSEKVIKIPKNINSKIKKYKYFVSEFEEKKHRNPTIDEIAEAMNTDIEEVKKIISLDKTILSLDKNYNDENVDLSENNWLVSPQNVEEDAILSSLKEQIWEVITHSNLSERELFVLKMRYGINEENVCYAFSYIADLLHISRQAVFQMENIALKKIRKNIEITYLIDYADKPENASKRLIKR